MFKKADSKIQFPKIEEEILKFWKKDNTFKKSLELRKKEGKKISNEYVFYDGPPFATGLPHYGHLLAGTIKDIVPRYWTMKGKYIERRFGWDTHGLPVEYEMEKTLGISGKKEIEEYGIDRFNEACRSIVLRYTAEWRDIVEKMGRWVDFDNDYKTMDLEFMESVWWVFKELYNKSLVYKGYKILPYCPRCSTPLSNFETNQGYKEVNDMAITVKFRLKGQKNTYILSWTTTPWTLPSNVALAMGKDIDYVKVQDEDQFFILAEARIKAYYRDEKEYKIIKRFKGIEFEGIEYIPLFNFFTGKKEEYPNLKNSFKTVLADYVSTDDGTGIVHIAPGFGEDDYKVGQNYNLAVLNPVDAEGKFTEEVPPWKGLFVKDADSSITEDLKARKLLIKKESYTHSYPHCWRCDSPLIYKTVATWFVKVETIKEKMLKANSMINWVPDHLKNGRFGKWLENARDWAISRNRYWGTPIPVWECDKCGDIIAIGSVNELEELTGKKGIKDIHKHFMDPIEFKCNKCGGNFKRIPEVFDCWFESGSMPYAQKHYPFENKEDFEAHFPADFIAEGLDQTRGWFYTLTVLSSALFDKPAFQNVIVNGLILAEDGKKMSKRMKNYPDPVEILNKYGADALRLYLISSPVVRAEDLKFSEKGIIEIMRSVLIPLWNGYSFFVTYANIDKYEPKDIEPPKITANINRWIISVFQSLVREINENMEKYEIQKAVPPIINFIELLTNWYIRRSRRKFWKFDKNDPEKKEAYETLFYILVKFAQVLAPFLPFMSEEIYKNLTNNIKNIPRSVHLSDYPEVITKLIDKDLEYEMDMIRRIVNIGRILRTTNKLKIRQPLSKMFVVGSTEKEHDIIKNNSDLLKEELNVKEVVISSNKEEIADIIVKPNFRILGPRLGKKISTLANALLSLDKISIYKLMKGENIIIKINAENIEISPKDIIIEMKAKKGVFVESDGIVTAGFDPHLSPELVDEGLARELVNKIQFMRKEQNFGVMERISVVIDTSDKVRNAALNFSEYIKKETLTENLEFDNNKGQEWDINGEKAVISVKVLKKD